MTTETEPMVRVITAKCSSCEKEWTPRLGPVEASVVRRILQGPCVECVCLGKPGYVLVVTEPVQ